MSLITKPILEPIPEEIQLELFPYKNEEYEAWLDSIEPILPLPLEKEHGEKL